RPPRVLLLAFNFTELESCTPRRSPLMSEVAPYAVRDGIAVITLNNPPVNGLGNALRAGVLQGLERAAADAQVKAVVLIGAGKAFSGGADIREFGKPREKPDLPDVNDYQDAMKKPLVAAVVYANKLVAERKPLRRIRDLQAKADVDLKKVRDEVAKASRGYPAPLEIVACVEAAVTKPFDEGRKFERERFAHLVQTSESA